MRPAGEAALSSVLFHIPAARVRAPNNIGGVQAPVDLTTGALRSHAPLPYQPLSADSPPRVCHDAWRLINTSIFPAEKRKSHMQRKRPSKIRKQVLERVWKETEEQRAPPKMVLLGSRGGESKILSGTPMLPMSDVRVIYRYKRQKRARFLVIFLRQTSCEATRYPIGVPPQRNLCSRQQSVCLLGCVTHEMHIH